MKILYAAFVRLPTARAHGVQIVKTCEALSAHGAFVTLVTPGMKTQVPGTVFDYYDSKKNFSIVPLNTPDWIRWGTMGFVLSALWFSEVLKWRKDFWDADIVYSRDAFVLLQYVLLGRSLVYEAHTAPTWVSTIVARRARLVVVISEGLRDAYHARGVPAERLVVAHDAVDLAPFGAVYDQKAVREELGVPLNKTIALYVGRIDAEKGAGVFAAASETLDAAHVAVLVGPGPLKRDLETRFPHAVFLPETPYRDLPRVLAAADILVIPNSLQSDNASLYTSPLKAYAYLAARKPIIAADVPALRAVFKDAVTYVQPDDPDSLARAIMDTESLKLPGLEPYTWDARATDILHALKAI